MPVAIKPFGTTPDGRSARLIELTNDAGMVAGITDLGACLATLRVPDAHGGLPDVVLGWNGADGYGVNDENMGAIVGRHVNRIDRARFELDGIEYQLTPTEMGNSLHSGPDKWLHRLWGVEFAGEKDGCAQVTFTLHSLDGDQGFPGAVGVRVTYTLTTDALELTLEATPDARTIINLTSHAYFNLNGHASGDTLGHVLSIDADTFLPARSDYVPTGEMLPVDGTPMDFRTPKAVGTDIDADYPLLRATDGYDHGYVLGEPGTMRHAARLVGEKSGVVMDVLTDEPGMQLYSSNQLDIASAKDGASYGKYAAICLETQFHPDSIHHPEWPQPVFGPDDPYLFHTTFRFGVAKA